ncbi:PEP-CTERM sorting domain-containing protein [Nostoc sp. LEGE 12450]|uniref:PEP-CTERM sorting domain-containing protein n=1 Tax=Nostoc sp. LEGE 12450 TaxID=1828643 RepID=UPI001881758F|nr:PEP-CTERM sorting domain-containing protein [Nostoc sp. LEGE 12450]MBE8987599.1 PEP-CTERM sorting domain-containing protein [Nostoc sp. LEGE 12450]
MANSTLSLFLGLMVTAVTLTPVTAQAATFDYSKIKSFSTRPIDSDYVLDFFGDISQNEGYALLNNLDPNAPDAGHVSIAKNALPGSSAYYTTGRPTSPAPNTATRSATLQNIKGFPNFSKYLNNNNIPLSSIGYTYGQKGDRDFTKALNLGEDKLGQDWFASPDSTLEERIYRTGLDDEENYLIYGTTKIVDFGYSPFYFAADQGPTRAVSDNFNVFLNDPVPATKAEGLDPLVSGLADAFLQDLAAAGGSVQGISEDSALKAEFTTYNGYDVTYVNFPFQIRAVSKSRNIPESSSGLGLLIFGALGAATLRKQQKKQVRGV